VDVRTKTRWEGTGQAILVAAGAATLISIILGWVGEANKLVGEPWLSIGLTGVFLLLLGGGWRFLQRRWNPQPTPEPPPPSLTAVKEDIDLEKQVRSEIHDLACRWLYPVMPLTSGQPSTQAWTFEEMVFEACATRGWERNFAHPSQTTEKVNGPWRFQIGQNAIEGEKADMDVIAGKYDQIARVVRDSKAARALRETIG
jgi:hypothetical protein